MLTRRKMDVAYCNIFIMLAVRVRAQSRITVHCSVKVSTYTQLSNLIRARSLLNLRKNTLKGI